MQRIIHSAGVGMPSARRSLLPGRRRRHAPSLFSSQLLSTHTTAEFDNDLPIDAVPISKSGNTGTTRRQRPIYVAATRQHVGKTSVSLALVSHFTKRYGSANVGYMKAVGQQCLRVWDEPQAVNERGEEEEGQYVTIDKVCCENCFLLFSFCVVKMIFCTLNFYLIVPARM